MNIKDIDYDIRRLNSFVLRLVLVVVLLSIKFFNENVFYSWVYFSTIAAYLILLILTLLFVKPKYKGIIRLVFDLIVIVVFLFAKDLNHILNFLPFVLLLYNVQSHSNKKDRILLFCLLVHVSIFIADNFKIKLTHHLIPVIFYLFIFIMNIRKIFSVINEEIIYVVGDLFVENVNENNSHRILRNVITRINDSKVGILTQIDEVFLFAHNNGKLVLVKGSKFVINNEMTSSAKFDKIAGMGFNTIANIGLMKKNSKVYKDTVTIDGVLYKNSFWLNHKVIEKNYFFLVTLKKDSVFNESVIANFRPIFEYIARIYYLNNSLIELNNSNAKIIKQKVAYVFDAQNALHFVKNKLSPITTTLDLMDRYFKQKDKLTEKNKLYIEKRLLENNNNAQIRTIMKKAEVLIKGVDNILNEEDKIITLKTFIDDLRKNWSFHFNNIDEVIINVSNLDDIELEINQMMFDFIFTDIIENINKYGISNNKKVELSISQDCVIVLFSNLIKDYERSRLELDEIVNLYNLKDNDEIYSRRTHGLSFVRRLLRRKNIDNKIFIDKELLTFNHEIKIKIHK